MTTNAPQNSPAGDTKVTRLSPAKINLFLHIVGKRADGYHNLQTVFRLLDWGDYLHFSLGEWLWINQLLSTKNSVDTQATAIAQQLITLTGAHSITDDVADNLIFRAAKALLHDAITSNSLPKQLQNVHITLDKQLPMGAGLGGGSSNAATTLLTLNELWQFHRTQDELIHIAATIGADVAIFIFGQDAIATGIGEQLTAIDLPDQHYLILTPNAHINTAELFAHPNLRRDSAPLSIETIKQQTSDYIQYLNAPYMNVFTPVVTRLTPAVDKALRYLQSLEPRAQARARMTGSGSAVFLPLDQSIIANQALLTKWLTDAPYPAYVIKNL